MSVNEKVIGDIARQFGVSANSGANKELVEKWKGKSDRELMNEILKIQRQLSENNISKEQQAQLIRRILPSLQGQEKARLQSVIEQMGIKL